MARYFYELTSHTTPGGRKLLPFTELSILPMRQGVKEKNVAVWSNL